MRYLSESISDEELNLLVEILNSDPSYKERYHEIVKTRAISFVPTIESKKSSNYIFIRKLPGLKLTSTGKLTPAQYLVRVAAILIFFFTTTISSYYIYNEISNSSVRLMTYTTVVPLGSQAKIVLPDGSVAWLNSGTTMKYTNRYGKQSREVEITGEGYFDVHKDEKKPFMVQAHDIRIKVLGTVFNVRSYASDSTVEVNLIEGKVDITKTGEETDRKITLLPNQKLVYEKQSKKMHSSYANAAKSAQWQIGKLQFVDATLEEIAMDLERKFDVQIYFESSDIKNEFYSGSLDLNLPVNTLLEYVDVDKKFTRIYNGKMITIKNKQDLN